MTLLSLNFPGVVVQSGDCLAQQCGVPLLDDQQKQICAENGYAGVKAGCADPSCVDWRGALNCITGNLMPRPTTAALPTITGTANAETPPSEPIVPLDLVRRLPSIVNTAPVEMNPPCSFSQWVADNPILAGGLLLGAAVLLLGGRR